MNLTRKEDKWMKSRKESNTHSLSLSLFLSLSLSLSFSLSLTHTHTHTHTMAGITKYLLISTMNFNDINPLIKRRKFLAGLKSKIQWSVLYKKHISGTKANIGLEWEGRKKDFQSKWIWKQAGVTILISGKMDLKPKLVLRDK
jgi:hypothetical protein